MQLQSSKHEIGLRKELTSFSKARQGELIAFIIRANQTGKLITIGIGYSWHLWWCCVQPHKLDVVGKSFRFSQFQLTIETRERMIECSAIVFNRITIYIYSIGKRP